MADAILRVQPDAKIKGVEWSTTSRHRARPRPRRRHGDIFSHATVRANRGEPPFEGADVDQVRHYYDKLTRAVADSIHRCQKGPFFRDDAKSRAFRDWLDEVGGEAREDARGIFQPPPSQATANDRLAARLVVIDKPAARAIPSR